MMNIVNLLQDTVTWHSGDVIAYWNDGEEINVAEIIKFDHTVVGERPNFVYHLVNLVDGIASKTGIDLATPGDYVRTPEELIYKLRKSKWDHIQKVKATVTISGMVDQNE